MPVTPYCNNLFQSRRDLYQFLSSYQQVSLKNNHPRIISISLEIVPIDPLVVLHQISQPDQRSFYFEKQSSYHEKRRGSHQVKIAAIGSAVDLQIEGSNRFAAAKAFIASTLKNTDLFGETHLPFSGPHFFCNFTFFEHNSPSKNNFSAATVFLPAWQIVCHSQSSVIVANVVIDADSKIDQMSADLWQAFATLSSLPEHALNAEVHHQEVLRKFNSDDTNHFKQAVRSALTSIQAEDFHKVVLAHAIDISCSSPFHLAASLQNLRKLHPDCYIFSASNGKGQTFIGASPERLVSLQQRQLVTEALAGSAPRGKTPRDDADLANTLLQSPKELHEHRVVTDFISQRLSCLGLQPQLLPLRLLQLSNIQHLQTPIHAAVPTNVHLLDIVATLHPTPAVAGMPRKAACDYIQQCETFERSLYAAPIGWVDHQGNGEFAVGIRSALIDGCNARLYAGAGIVAGSDPERELAEVELKLQALLTALV